MKFNTETNTLYLSRRNLLALLGKLKDPDSARTLIGGDAAPGIRVIAEPDTAHYQKRVPGRMSDSTEAFIRSYDK